MNKQVLLVGAALCALLFISEVAEAQRGPRTTGSFKTTTEDVFLPKPFGGFLQCRVAIAGEIQAAFELVSGALQRLSFKPHNMQTVRCYDTAEVPWVVPPVRRTPSTTDGFFSAMVMDVCVPRPNNPNGCKSATGPRLLCTVEIEGQVRGYWQTRAPNYQRLVRLAFNPNSVEMIACVEA
jgi:hypothetical protein